MPKGIVERKVELEKEQNALIKKFQDGQVRMETLKKAMVETRDAILVTGAKLEELTRLQQEGTDAPVGTESIEPVVPPVAGEVRTGD